jgi:hypothetical protein
MVFTASVNTPIADWWKHNTSSQYDILILNQIKSYDTESNILVGS